MENHLVFAVIGLLTGSAVRLICPGRQWVHVLGTVFVAGIGAVVGGALSWNWWPAEVGLFHTGNLVLSMLGAAIAILLWVGIGFQRRFHTAATTAS